ncbi:acyl-CoA dehydrogenase family protein, partial [Paracoccus sp. (in: a-proteobacteria)]|uniref:acyl-CoA dehydrogenase family protein n=1 Tax=Paracoccus sp. TaxID=267 RepID=UPI0026FEC9F9|nr:hypothetical protein [Paracoccus sp. (in: a-proteobacteria)]
GIRSGPGRQNPRTHPGQRVHVQGKLAPRVIAAWREGQTDPATFREMRLPGVTVPEKHSGFGASCVSYGLGAREVERVDSSDRSPRTLRSRGALRGRRG